MKTALLLAVTVSLSATLRAAPPEPKFRAITLDDKIQIGYGLAIADVDGDEQPDILLADKKQFVWYRNPGSAKAGDPAAWQKFVLAENLTKNDNVCIAAHDIDGDGKCEVAVGAEWNPGDTVGSGAVFYLIAPADRTQKWEPVKFPSVEPTTHRMRWFNAGAEWFDGGKNYWGLVVVPLHGRGNKNGEGAPVKVLFYRPPVPLNDPKGEWKSSIVIESQHATHNFHYETPRALYFGGREGIVRSLAKAAGKWEQDTFEHTRESRGVGEIRIGRTGPFGRAFFCAVEPMHGNELVLYPFGPGGGRQVLTNNLVEGHALGCGDLLGVKGDQIVVGWRGNPPGVHLWTPFDDQGTEWRDSAIDDGGMACEDLQLADLNGDGKLDIVAAGRGTKNVKVYLNETPP